MRLIPDFRSHFRAQCDATAPGRRTSAQPTRLAGRHLVILLSLLLAGCSRSELFEGTGQAPLVQEDAGETAPSSIVLFGGIGQVGDAGFADLNDTWIWSSAIGWTEAHPPNSPSPRSSAMAASLGGNVLLFGGDGSVAETWVWDGATWTQRQPGWSPPPLTSSVLVSLNQGLVLFGGYDYGTLYHDVWQWDGATWAHEDLNAHPPANEAPAGAVLNGSLVVFGGEGTDLLPHGDTWAYDGTSWTQLHPASSPSPRRGAVAVTYRGQIVLFGGDTIPEPYGDWVSVNETWVWDGTDWTQQHPAQSPDARSCAGRAVAGGKVVLFGGTVFGGAGGEPAGTWTWDGSDWTKETGPGPSPRNSPAMAAR
jgi:hypothetical protein